MRTLAKNNTWRALCLGMCLLTGVAAAKESPPPLDISTQQVAKVNFSPIFITLSDAMGFVKAGDNNSAKSSIAKALSEFEALSIKDSELKTKVRQDFERASSQPTAEHLSALSTQLYALEKQQNPVDYRAKRAAFSKKITPALQELQNSVMAFDGTPQSLTTLKASYEVFNRTWTANERVVRNTQTAYYGKIETAMALLRVAIESSPPSQTQIKQHLDELVRLIEGYQRGDTLQVKEVKQVDLAYGVQLLTSGLQSFKDGDTAGGQTKLGEFIQIWPSIEGQVATSNPSLYSQVESQIPVIMANGQNPKQQAALQALIDDLQTIAPDVRYGVVDAMLILLREGLEALLIVMALLTAMKAAGQDKGKRYVYAGVGAGLLASVIGAIALQRLFPAMTSGTSREILEGVVGIFAVVMMIGVGMWLHSKASIKAWNAYINKHTATALSAGSFMGLFGLSFLSVFREGAETILFYVGILPKITMGDFLLGIVIALVLLAVIGIILAKTSLRLPIPKLFLLLTVLIYVLAFKILGVSVHALQLTGVVPMTITSTPAVPFLGIYSTEQGLMVQGLFLVVVIILILKTQKTAH